jgi:hypothetical protein
VTGSGIHSDASPSTGFPGFGEGAPLDLPDLTSAQQQAVVARLVDGSFGDWSEAAAGVGYCARPVRLVGNSMTIDATTGEVLSSFSSNNAPLGMLYRACGNRRDSVCPACSRTYARDTYAMIQTGMCGGKTVPEEVAENPLLFVTLTAPTFGPVHGHRDGQRCRPRDRAQRCPHGRPSGCLRNHAPDDPANGSPICPDCYDWDSAMVWQWWAPELWRRTTIALRRALAAALGIPERSLGDIASLQYAKVAEYQARGLIHFHALIRLDGPDGPGSPALLIGRDLADLVKNATRGVTYLAAPVDDEDTPRVLGWGQQLDVRVVRAGRRVDTPTGPVTPEQVAGYLAKYATKDASSIRTPGQPIPHLRRLEETCCRLAARARAFDEATDYRLLAKWAPMLGFRGHFSSKSRRYSVTLGRLRRARHRFQQLTSESRRTGVPLDTRDLEALLLADDDETTLVIGSWTYQGTGWTSPGDETLALAAASRAREHHQWRASRTAA